MRPRRAAAGLSAVFSAFFVLGSCATMQARPPEVQPDGTYRVVCDTTLGACLAPFESCHHGFDVVRAREEHHRRGPEPAAEFVSSEAILRCRLATTSGSGKDEQAPASTNKAATTCFPGATEACLGPGACQGAQICSASGASFGPCDCGTSRVGPPA